MNDSSSIVQHTRLHIDGDWRDASDGATIDVLNPATEKLLAQVACGTVADIDLAVAAARREIDGGAWSRMSGGERGRLMLKLADLMERDAEVLAMLETLDVGKTISESRMVDVPAALETLRYFAGWADKIEGRFVPTADLRGRATHSYTVREPVGVVGAITPWNAPLMITLWKLAPALAAGCTMVLKPAEDAPLSTLHLAGLIQEAGFPPGVVNVVPGIGRIVGAALSSHEGVDKVSFTGSPGVGRQVSQAAAGTFKQVALELGGKSPQIILPDADLEAAVRGTARGLFANQGEVCAAGTRVLVHRSIADVVVKELAAAAEAVQVGDPLADETTMGALISSVHRDRVLTYVDRGRAEGAKLVTGGNRISGAGYFMEPTIFQTDDASIAIAREEIFGPVGTVLVFDEVDQAIELANSTTYGLAACVWTSDLSTAHLAAKRLRAGTVWVNCWGAIDPRLPWGGVKHSGLGRELGYGAIEAHTEEKSVRILL